MKFYNIFLKNDEKGVVEDLILLKEGFNIYPPIFGVFWFLYKKCYISALILTIINYVISTFLDIEYYIGIYVGIFLLMGFESNRILMKKYIKSGYKYLGYTSGKNEIEAKRRFLDSINKDGFENKESNSD